MTRYFGLYCPSGNCFGHVEDTVDLAPGTVSLRVRCKGKYCRLDGHPVIHVFDLATGQFFTLPDVLDDAGERPAEITQLRQSAAQSSRRASGGR